MLLGSINHVSLTVSNLPEAMKFYGPILEFMGFRVGEIVYNESAETRLTINANPNEIYVNIWEAKPGLADHAFEVYEPGLHHVAFNAATHEQVDELCALVPKLGGEILDGPGEFPYGPGGYYAVYFKAPGGLKFEFVHMPLLERIHRERGLL